MGSREIATPRVLVLASPIDGPGGIERVSRSCITAFGERYGPERVGLLTLGKSPDGLPCRVLDAGKPFSGQVGPLAKIRFVWKTLSAARRWKKNLVLVVAHPHLASVAAMASRITGAPFAVWCHGSESWGSISRLAKVGLQRASLVFAPSRFTAREVERAANLPDSSVRVVHHGLGQELFGDDSYPQNERAPALIAVARLTSEHAYKGIDSLLYAWPRVTERVPEARLWVVGDGSDVGRLKSIAESLGLNGKVQFFGQVTDGELTGLYSSASVFALPSRSQIEPRAQGEGFGVVYIEAGAAGLPVIAAQGAGTEDAVEHGLTGLLIDPANQKELEEAIVLLLTDKALALRMGEEGRRRAGSEFSYDAFADRICGVVDELFSIKTENL